MQKAIQIPYDEQFSLQCQLIREAGFGHVAVNFNCVPSMTEEGWKAATEDIGNILAKNGLSCVQTHLKYHNLLESSEIPDEVTDFHICQSLLVAGALGAKYNVFHPRSSISSGYRPSKSFEDNRALLSKYLEYAVKGNTAVAVENLPIFPARSKLMPFYSSSFEDLSTLVDFFSDEHIVICWDFGHANLMKWEQSDAIGFLGDRIKCTHIHNNFGFCDDHSTPDMGNIDWKSAMAALAAVGYNGPLTLETHCWYDDQELLRSFIRHNFACVEYLERLMKQER